MEISTKINVRKDSIYEDSVNGDDLDPNINFKNSNKSNSIFKNNINISNNQLKIDKSVINEIAKKNILLITNLTENLKSDNGSLYNLFASEYFDMHYINYYFYSKDNQGVIDFLVNELYKRFTDESFFYLPQLW